ncbi:protein ABHD15-like [Ptychodera flava]|uniref:protein ABHD15-like n=1 Tax=Ptychodera flava TaxID=63121 RepID=UPI003969CE12
MPAKGTKFAETARVRDDNYNMAVCERRASFSLPSFVFYLYAFLTTLIISIYMLLQNAWNSKMPVSPKLYYKESTLASSLLKKCVRLNRPYSPTVWARNGNLQTILAFVLPQPDVLFRRKYFQLKDEGVIALDWVVPSKTRRIHDRTSIVLILPGLTGGLERVSDICREATRRGLRAIVFNKRGHGGSPLTTPKLQSFGDTSDLRQVIKYIRDLYKHAKITAIGLSTGSGLLVSYLGEYGSSTYLSTAVCISPGYSARDMFEDSIKNPYRWFVLQRMKLLLAEHANAISDVIDVDRAFRSKSIAEFEQSVYCKLYGYEDMDTYWEKNDPMREVDEIAVPILCINSMDDPICSKELIPFDLFTMLPNFMLVTTERGGHCGFFEGWQPESWANRLSLDYIEAVLEFMQTASITPGSPENSWRSRSM